MLGTGALVAGFFLVISWANRARRERAGRGFANAALVVLGLEFLAMVTLLMVGVGIPGP